MLHWVGTGSFVLSPEVTSVSIVRIGLAETKNFAEGYGAIFGKKKSKKDDKPTAKRERRQEEEGCEEEEVGVHHELRPLGSVLRQDAP